MNARVTALRYYGIAGPAFDEAVAHFSGPWGLTLVENTGEVAYLAAEGSPEFFCLRLRRDTEKRHDLTAFGTDSAADVDAIIDGWAARTPKAVMVGARRQWLMRPGLPAAITGRLRRSARARGIEFITDPAQDTASPVLGLA